MADEFPLPRWQSHKTVHAAKIIKVEGNRLDLEIPDPHNRHTGIAQTRIVIAAHNMFARYTPVPGDYYVVYDDGFASISPRQAFEAGYHPL